MHMVFLPTKEDVRMPEADPKFRGETWQTATEAQARPALTRSPILRSLCASSSRMGNKSPDVPTCKPQQRLCCDLFVR